MLARTSVTALLLAAPALLLAATPVAAGATGGRATATTIVVTCGTGATCTDGRLQKAIARAASGDTVRVGPGTYEEDIDFDGESIDVESEDGPALTVIDGNGSSSVVTFDSGEPATAVLQGFTVTHGSNVNGGGGVRVTGGASPTIRDDDIVANEGCTQGAGIFVMDGTAQIIGNAISDNIGGRALGCSGYVAGGGIDTQGADALIAGNTITGNEMDAGAGIATSGGADLIEDNVIEHNSDNAQGGATGIELYDAAAGTEVVQNLVADNVGAGADSSAVRVANEGTVTLLNNTIVATTERFALWLDTSVVPPYVINDIVVADQVPLGCSPSTLHPYLAHDDVWGRYAPTGLCERLLFYRSNLWVAPRFVGSSALDFHESATSATVGAGETSDKLHPFVLPSTDLAGGQREVDGHVDIGAYELG